MQSDGSFTHQVLTWLSTCGTSEHYYLLMFLLVFCYLMWFLWL